MAKTSECVMSKGEFFKGDHTHRRLVANYIYCYTISAFSFLLSLAL
jgi:hypothetical protein